MRKSVTPEQRNALLGLPSATTTVKTGDAFVDAADWVPERVRAGYLPYFVSGPLTKDTIYTLSGALAFLTTILHVGAWILTIVADHEAQKQVWDSAYDANGVCKEGKSATCNAVRFWVTGFRVQAVAFGLVLLVTGSHSASIFLSHKWAKYLYVTPGKATPLLTMLIMTPVKIAVLLSIVGLLTIDADDISSTPGRRLQLFTLDYGTFAGWAVVALLSKMTVLGFLEQNTAASLTWEPITREGARERLNKERADARARSNKVAPL